MISFTTSKSGGLTVDPKRVYLYLSQTRLPRLSESNGGQGPQRDRKYVKQDRQDFFVCLLVDSLSTP